MSEKLNFIKGNVRLGDKIRGVFHYWDVVESGGQLAVKHPTKGVKRIDSVDWAGNGRCEIYRANTSNVNDIPEFNLVAKFERGQAVNVAVSPVAATTPKTLAETFKSFYEDSNFDLEDSIEATFKELDSRLVTLVAR